MVIGRVRQALRVQRPADRAVGRRHLHRHDRGGLMFLPSLLLIGGCALLICLDGMLFSEDPDMSFLGIRPLWWKTLVVLAIAIIVLRLFAWIIGDWLWKCSF